MPTNYPSALDDSGSLPTKTAGDSVSSAETNTQSGAIKAIEAKLGIGSSTPAQGKEIGSTATGTTDWRERAVIDARDYGAFPDSASDEAGHIQDAIDACATLGGGIVRLLPGTYLTGTALVISTNSVVLEGAGMKVTFLERTGADTSAVVYIQTPDMDTSKIYGAGCRRLTIDGSATALYGLRVTTANLVDVQQVEAKDCTTYQMYLDCWDDRNGGDARDNQGCSFRDIGLVCTGSQGGIKLHGNSDAAIGAGDGANTSLNYFANVNCVIVNGNGFLFGNSDGNVLDFLRVYSSGSGVGLVFGASALVTGGHARNNIVYGAQPSSAGITANSNTTPSGPNWVHLNTGNGGVPSTVTVSGSAVLHYITETGIIYPYIDIPEIGTAATPDSGYSRIYAAGDSRLHFVDDGGNIGLIGSSGQQPFAYPLGFAMDAVSDSAITLIAGATNCGAFAVPILVVTSFKPQTYTVRQGSTATARTAEARLYRDNGDGTFDSVSGSDATWSFTPSAVSNEVSSACSGSPTLIPGIYWLVFRNTHATNTFVVRRLQNLGTGAVGEFRATNSLTWNATGIPALGSTIDISTVETKGASTQYFVRVNGKVGGSAW